MTISYNVGDLVRVGNNTWRVRKVYPGDSERGPSVGLENPDNPNHGTAFYVSVLARIGTLVQSASNPTNLKENEMRDRDQIEAMEIGREWAITRHANHTEFKIGNRFDAGPKVDVWWETDGSARSAASFDGDGELMTSVDKDVMGWLAHQLR